MSLRALGGKQLAFRQIPAYFMNERALTLTLLLLYPQAFPGLHRRSFLYPL